MFTGIVETIGDVLAVETHGDSAVLAVHAPRIAGEAGHGASVAVNGVCLTVIGHAAGERIDFDVMGETLERSALGALHPGDRVNLERAVRADGRLDGHVVQGHVDATGVVVSRQAGEAARWHTVRFGLPGELARQVAGKGSIAVDGVSLTVTSVGPDWFEVGLIPETLRATTLGERQPGDRVNIEIDVLAKYVARLLERPA